MSDTAVNRIEGARRKLTASIKPSLLPLLFRRLEKTNPPSPPLRAFEPGGLTRTASIVCKFSALLVQASWLIAALRKRSGESPKRLNDHLLQIWAGNQTFTEGSAISILQEAAGFNETNGRQTVINPHVFVPWGEHFAHKRPNLKSFLKSLRGEDWYAAFDALITALPILGTTDFTGRGFVFKDEPELPLFPFLHRSLERGRYLYLYDFDQSATRIIYEDPYSDHTEDLVLQDHPDLNERYCEIRELLGLGNVRENVLYLFGTGYKHIERLAITISGTPSAALKKVVKAERMRLASTTGEMEDEEVITLLLAREGPTTVLKQLIVADELFETYLEKLEIQTFKPTGYWNRLYEEMRNRKLANFQGYLDLDPKLREETIPRFEVELKCWCVCKAAGFTISDPLDYVEGMGVKLAMLENFLGNLHENHEDQQKILGLGTQIQKLVERTFRFLVVFYSGLKGYYNKLEENEFNYHACEKGLFDAARRSFRESHKSAAELIKMFAELCSTMNKKGPPERLLGRPEVCNLKKFWRLATENNWVGIFNRLKHDKASGNVSKEVTSDEVMSFANDTLKIFSFLQYGDPVCELEETARKNSQLSKRVPVYPMVVSFREQHRIRDGLVTYSYRIHRSDGLGADERESVNIMTPREYIANEDYYCIPFHKRITNQWLLDPFLIRCSKIDEILNERID